MAYVSNQILATSEGTQAWFKAYIALWQDPDNPSARRYAELTGVSVYATNSSSLNSLSISISIAGSSFTLSSLKWSSILNMGNGTWYRSASNCSDIPTVTLNLNPLDAFYCSVNMYISSYRAYCGGTLYFTKYITPTPPATVKLNYPNFFSCGSFTIPDSPSMSASGFGNLLPSRSSSLLWLDETTQFSKAVRGSTYSGFYWYPNKDLAKDGDFSGGTGEYSISPYVDINIPWYSTSLGGGGGLYLAAIKFQRITGTIRYNETPPSSAAPAVTLIAEEISGTGLLAEYGKYIKGKSQVKYTATVIYKYGAKKTHFDLTVGSNYTTALSFSFWPETAGTATAYAEDDYGSVTEVSLSYDVYNYWSPGISAAIHRCTQNGTPDDAGSYCKIEWEISIAPLGNQNSRRLTITHPAGTTTPSLSSYTASGTLIVAADPEHSYNISFALKDDFVTTTRTMRLSTAGVIMDIYHGGHGIAMGKVAETDFTFEISSDWDVLLNTRDAKQIKLVDALKALANATGVNIYTQ